MRTKFTVVAMGLLCLLLSRGVQADLHLYNDGGVHNVTLEDWAEVIVQDGPPPEAPTVTTVNLTNSYMITLNTSGHSQVFAAGGSVTLMQTFGYSQVTGARIQSLGGLSETHDHSSVSVTLRRDYAMGASYDDSHAVLDGGGDGTFWNAYERSRVEVVGGIEHFGAHDYSQVNLRNGEFVTADGYSKLFIDGSGVQSLITDAYSQTIMTDGVLQDLIVGGDSQVTLLGGRLGYPYEYGVRTSGQGHLTIVGSNFALYNDFSWAPGYDPTPIFSGYGDLTGSLRGVLRGTMAGGVLDEIPLWISDDSRVSLVLVPVPGAVLLGAIGLSVAGWRLRRRTAWSEDSGVPPTHFTFCIGRILLRAGRLAIPT